MTVSCQLYTLVVEGMRLPGETSEVTDIIVVTTVLLTIIIVLLYCCDEVITTVILPVE